MGKRSLTETRFETRLREVARQREDFKYERSGVPGRNRAERRLNKETVEDGSTIPAFKSEAEADKWLARQERRRRAARERALTTRESADILRASELAAYEVGDIVTDEIGRRWIAEGPSTLRGLRP